METNSPFIQPPSRRNRTRIIVAILVVTFAAMVAPSAWAAIRKTDVRRISGWAEIKDGDSNRRDKVSVIEVNGEVRCYLYRSEYGSHSVGGESCLPLDADGNISRSNDEPQKDPGYYRPGDE